ncbi:MAG: prepilin-type N-terminal cleavage/methylation domain-containing protein [Patescibacteria group bacterium]|nr:MAG: prepilin-type N-terminal cleavage/methylation domain-containing protein [Patescibacteria group bacterium]
MILINRKNKKAFTLIELLVVIAIIGVLSTLVIVSLGDSRAKARDSKRLNDLKAMANALELYYANNNSYPQAANFSPGQPLEAGGIVYMSKVPNNPTPHTDGNCPDSDYLYSQAQSGQSYVIGFCLGSDTPSLASGVHTVTSEGLNNVGLIAWWKFDETSGSTATDHSSSGWNLTGINHAWLPSTDCRVGGCISFPGSSARAYTPTGKVFTSPNQQLTFAMWAYRTGSSDGHFSLFGSSYQGPNPYVWLFGNNSSSSLIIQHRTNSSYTGSTLCSSCISLNSWNHYVITTDWIAKKASIYKDGVHVNTVNLHSETLFPDTSHVKIVNAYSTGGGHGLYGRMDDYRIYNRVLSLEEIQMLYALGQ